MKEGKYVWIVCVILFWLLCLTVMKLHFDQREEGRILIRTSGREFAEYEDIGYLSESQGERSYGSTGDPVKGYSRDLV